MKGKNILSIKELSRDEILSLIDRAQEMKRAPSEPILKGKIMASCFFEPSTRTRLSFEAAMRRLGGEVIGFSEATSTAVKKGESLYDSMKVLGLYSDVVVIRHPLEGSARYASESTQKPVINAGDGANEHPTQTLLDLFSIRECQGKLDGLGIAFAGDLLNGRAVHSLAFAMKAFDCRLYFIAPRNLALPESVCDELKKEGVPFSFHEKIEEVIERIDILYMTRLQKERLSHEQKEYLCLTPKMLEKAKENFKVLHPLPRVDEISKEIDETPHAYYFEQAENGLYVRQALLAEVLGK